MPSLMAGRVTRYLLLALVILTTLWLWRPSFQFQPAPPMPLGFIPAKLYEPAATVCTDNLAEESRPVSL